MEGGGGGGGSAPGWWGCGGLGAGAGLILTQLTLTLAHFKLHKISNVLFELISLFFKYELLLLL